MMQAFAKNLKKETEELNHVIASRKFCTGNKKPAYKKSHFRSIFCEAPTVGELQNDNGLLNFS